MDSNGKQDRLSSLPDPLLVHILSFLPTTQAVKTMLIKPFGNLWTSLPNLDLNDSFVKPSSSDLPLFRFVPNLLLRHTNPKIDKFRININRFLLEIEDQNLRPDVDSWINFALGKQVQVLEFSVGVIVANRVYILHKFPHSVFISDSLIELKLNSVEMKLERRVQMRSLRNLRLTSVKISDEVFREIISGCPLLKKLEIGGCWGFNELNLDASNIEVLKLKTDGHHIRINCPNMRSLDFSGFVESVEFINLSSLLDLTLHLQCRNMMDFQVLPQLVAVVKKFVHAKFVSLSSLFTMVVLFYCLLKDIPHLMFDWKRVNLSIWLTDWHIPALNHLLSNSTCLEKLVIHIKIWHPISTELESELNSYVLDKEGSWSCLKSITIHDISRCLRDLVARLVEILLKKAFVLDELVIYYHQKFLEFTSKEVAAFSKRLSTFSKASRHAKILLVRKN